MEDLDDLIFLKVTNFLSRYSSYGDGALFATRLSTFDKGYDVRLLVLSPDGAGIHTSSMIGYVVGREEYTIVNNDKDLNKCLNFFEIIMQRRGKLHTIRALNGEL